MQTQIVFLNKTIDPLLEVLRMLVGKSFYKTMVECAPPYCSWRMGLFSCKR